MSLMKIHTNHIPREVTYGWELSPKERAEFDWLTEANLETAEFVRYKGMVYPVCEFSACGDLFPGWDGYVGDSYFSGVLMRYARVDGMLDFGHAIMGWFCC